MDTRGEKFLADIIHKGSLPSLSPLAMRLMSLAAQEDAQARDLARIIEADPSLTARLLSLVNSAMYRRSDTEISSITRAVMMLGLREVRIMALSLSLRDTMPAKKAQELDYTLFWRLNVQRAIMSQRVSQLLGMPNSEEAFTAGLVVNIGLPVMLRNLPPDIRQHYPGLGVTRGERLEWEDRELGINHRQIGAAVVKHWHLPSSFTGCMLYPFHPSNDIMAKIIDFADFAVEIFILPQWSFTEIHLHGEKALGLSVDQVNTAIADTLEMAGQVAESLQVEMDQEQDMLAVMEKANAALSRLSSTVTPKLRQVVDKAVQLDNQRLQQQTISNTLEAVMHEIRNPLMSVGGFARRLANQGDKDSAAQRYAQVIVDEASRLDKVLGQVSMLLAPVKPLPVKLDLLELMHHIHARANGFKVTWHLPAGNLWLVTDGKLLEEAIVLLLQYAANDDNALELGLVELQGEINVQLSGQGQLPSNQQLEELAFGSDLNLVRIRRIMEGLGGDFATTLGDGGFTLALNLPGSN